MPVLDEQVRRRDDPPVGYRHHRGVVARAEQGRLDPREPRGDPLDQPELAQFRNGDDARLSTMTAAAAPIRPLSSRIATCATFYRSR